MTSDPALPARTAADAFADAFADPVGDPVGAIVVGAGPSGLAVGRELQRRGIEPLLLERDVVGASWAEFYDRLQLHTPKELVALPDLPLPAGAARLPSRDAYLAYLQRYARHFGLRVVPGSEVRRAEPLSGGGWRVEASDGERRARALVIASGVAATPHRPALPGLAGFRGTVLHSADVRRVEELPASRILIVGFGNSGKDLATILAEAGRDVAVALRDGVVLRSYPNRAWPLRLGAWALRTLPREITEPVLRRTRRGYPEFGLPLPDKPPLEATPVLGLEPLELVRRGRLHIHAGLVGFAGSEVRFADGERADYDVVVLATGYRPTIDFLPPGTDLDPHGRFVAPPPGLHALGFHYPATEAFLQAMPRDARRVAREVAREMRRA